MRALSHIGSSAVCGDAVAAEMKELAEFKTSIVHDWMSTVGGAERVVQGMAQCFPQAHLFTVFDFLDPTERQELIGAMHVHTSPLNALPGVRRYYRNLILAAARAIEAFDVTGFDLVLSSSAALAKGVITAPDQCHIAYVHSPARYAWDLSHDYRAHMSQRGKWVKRAIAHEMMHRLRIWDMRTVAGVDHFIANSSFVQSRIWKVYRRQSHVIHPPVDTDYFQPGPGQRQDYFFTASRLVSYKRVHMIAEAFARRPELQLLIAGDGPEMSHLRKIASPNIKILGRIPRETLRHHLQNCRAFIFAAREDFGIAPVEANACGTPVIALNAAGTAETIRGFETANPTGVLFDDQSTGSLLEALDAFLIDGDSILPADCRQQALKFAAPLFQQRLTEFVRHAVDHRDGTLVRAAE